MNAALTEALAANPFFTAPLFDALPDVVFFVKDAACRYVLVNDTLVRRCGLKTKAALVGRTAAQVFRPPFGDTWLAQDQAVLASGSDIFDRLELHLYPDRDPGWCLTRKLALRDGAGSVVGLCGVSRDLAMADKKNPGYSKLAAAVRLIQHEYARALSMTELAATAGMSVAQLERYFVRIFQINPRQMLIKTRLDAAAQLLAGDDSIANVALACGYSDHSAFTRQFKATVGMTPAQYRALRKG